MISSLLGVARILIVWVTFFLGYRIGFEHGYDPVAQFHFLIPIIVVTVAGVSGIEGLLDGNYQRQSAIRRRNFSWQNANRPFIALLLIGGMIYPVVLALKGL